MSTGMEKLRELARLIRFHILTATTRAGSGHPSSSLSAAELMTALVFGGIFRYDADRPEHPNNDRLLFSKGHASPLLYALWLAAGKVTEEEMLSYREFGSVLEGHPVPAFPYAEAATGSLGQGLSIGLGMALNAKYLGKFSYRTYVLLGDSEMSEGAQWEAVQVAAHYKLDNLVAVLDVNRLGQRGETMYGRDLEAYRKRVSAFDWEAIVVRDGHAFPEILEAYQKSLHTSGKPVMIIAGTIKGKGVPQIEDQDGWHGKALKREDMEKALGRLGKVDTSLRGEITQPGEIEPEQGKAQETHPPSYNMGEVVPTRKAYGTALNRIFPRFPALVSLDAEVSNSTGAEVFKKEHPENFFEMFITEQNMVGAALGLARRGKLPFVSTFGAFLSRAFDQIRMSRYSDADIKFVGSHAGVSIGEDGPSQMALEDISMFRSIPDSVVLYPCDAVSAEKLVEEAAEHRGIVYIRTTRGGTPVIYGPEEVFPIGGSKTLRKSEKDLATVIGAGITLHEALAAYDLLKEQDIAIRVIDLYSVKPLDEKTLVEAAGDTRFVVTVEDHYPAGGLGEAVKSLLCTLPSPVYSLAVTKKPKSGKPSDLLDFEEISAKFIADEVKNKLRRHLG
jgi:transketolase